jgi:hypothetical protein
MMKFAKAFRPKLTLAWPELQRGWHWYFPESRKQRSAVHRNEQQLCKPRPFVRPYRLMKTKSFCEANPGFDGGVNFHALNFHGQ